MPSRVASEIRQRQISFASTTLQNIDIPIADKTPNLKGLPEISIDEKSARKGSGFSIPEMHNDGQFIRNGYEQINHYDLKNVKPKPVAAYRAISKPEDRQNKNDSKQD